MKGPRLYGHGRMVNGRWVRDDPGIKPMDKLRHDLDKVKAEIRSLKWMIGGLRAATASLNKATKPRSGGKQG